MARRYFVDSLPAPGPASLRGDAVHHIWDVLRAGPGDEVVLADGRGGECRARIDGRRGGELLLTTAPALHVPPSRVRVHLAFAPPRLARAEWLFEHGTEVGVAVFHPLASEHARPPGNARDERWQKIVRAAAGQCDRAWLPEVRPVRALREFLADPALPADRRLATGGAPAPAPVAGGEVVLLVGPEGGFAAEEQELARAHGFLPMGLGPHVLRTETAALVGAAVLQLAATQPTPAQGNWPGIRRS
jgi:16S rRNA (uracil1498-N3)-methyltransferase